MNPWKVGETIMSAIINLTQHPATAEQLAAGVVDLPAAARASLQNLLTFDHLPTRREVVESAEAIARLAARNTMARAAMIGGAPYLMAPLEQALRELYGIEPVYAFSVRESREEVQPDGSTRKIAVFRHAGFVGGGS